MPNQAETKDQSKHHDDHLFDVGIDYTGYTTDRSVHCCDDAYDEDGYIQWKSEKER